MKSLAEIIKEAENKKVAIGHFNISDSVTLKAIFESAKELGVPIIIGTSEGERDFIGAVAAAALIKSLREEFNYPIYINADHTHSLEKVKEAVHAGYDAILFDGGKLPFEENIAKTKEIVAYVQSKNPEILVEGELGYIGSASEVFKELPKGAAVRPEDLTTPEQAREFVERTGVDMLAPAVGNIHGMFANAQNPRLDIERISAIKKAIGIPLVLHGGSGTRDEDFVSAIKAGVGIIHINTELRVAWRRGVEEGLAGNPREVAPYKILPPALKKIKDAVSARLKLFSNPV